MHPTPPAPAPVRRPSSEGFTLRTDALTKRFDRLTAVEGLDLHIRPGEIYGFLGPNGAGKTTTIYMLLGLLQPTSGGVFLFGEPLMSNLLALKHRIGVVAEEPVLSSQMTGWETVRFFADLHRTPRPAPRMEALFHELDLWQARDALLSTYSRGMRQKLSLIRAMIHRPDLLILDEPVSGLDPHGILQVREVVEQHRREGGSALISSHILSEIERSADRVGILHQGRLLIEDTIEGIRRRLGQDVVVHLELVALPPTLLPALRALPHLREAEVAGNCITLRLERTADDLRPLIFQRVVESGGLLTEMRSDEMTLEEAFVTITHQTVDQLAGAQ